jgi:hypothetical protein
MASRAGALQGSYPDNEDAHRHGEVLSVRVPTKNARPLHTHPESTESVWLNLNPMSTRRPPMILSESPRAVQDSSGDSDGVSVCQK